jgi:hypothetical protein
MRNSHLPRSRKVTINPSLESPPEKFEIRPIIERKSVITGFEVAEPSANIIRDRRKIIEKIREKYPQVTKSQLDDAQFGYGEFRAKIELRQFSDAPN